MSAKRVRIKSAQTSGGARLIAAGKRPVNLGLLPEEYDLLRRAADAERRPLTQFLMYHGLMAAKEILGKIEKRP